MKYLILALIVAAATALSILIISDAVERGREYNRYMCAVYGYYEDCKTPRSAADKLK